MRNWSYNDHLWHLGHHGVGDKHVDGPGAAHPDQLRHGVEEGEAGVRQVVYQDDLQYIRHRVTNAPVFPRIIISSSDHQV